MRGRRISFAVILSHKNEIFTEMNEDGDEGRTLFQTQIIQIPARPERKGGGKSMDKTSTIDTTNLNFYLSISKFQIPILTSRALKLTVHILLVRKRRGGREFRSN